MKTKMSVAIAATALLVTAGVTFAAPGGGILGRIQALFGDVQSSLAAIGGTVNATNAAVTDPDSGLAAIQNGIDAIQSKLHVQSPGTLTLSSGPFDIPAENDGAVEWSVINDSDTVQTISVSVYKYGVNTTRELLGPGTITTTLLPGASFHNANSIGDNKLFSTGAAYEVVVNTSSPNVLPMVTVWAPNSNASVPGTTIPAGDWVKLQ
ncbi:MAG TPA: hypothetical protein VFH85_04095 [Gammaproteobacteria bacterium]|nr:hypothetical protein [Gammaproteobacteria bacterium]